MSDYDTDVVTWSEAQAALLRRLAAGERVNAAVVDWPNIIDEIETVGRSEIAAVESLIAQVPSHRLKIAAWPDSPSAGSWRREVRAFRRQLRRRYTPFMRQRMTSPGCMRTRSISCRSGSTAVNRCPSPRFARIR